DVDVVQDVAADHVAVGRGGPADDVVVGVVDVDAGPEGRHQVEGGVGVAQAGAAQGAGGVGADEVAGDGVAVGLHQDAVAAEAVDHQALDDRAVAAAAQRQAGDADLGGARARAAAVQLDEQDGVVAVGQRVGRRAGLAVAVDGDGVDDGRLGR